MLKMPGPRFRFARRSGVNAAPRVQRSLFVRSIIGAYHKVSAKHLDAYLDELEFRYSNRNNEWAFRDAMLKLVSADKLTYEQLTNGTKEKTSDGVENAPRNPAALSQTGN
jgi:hypothetical protein